MIQHLKHLKSPNIAARVLTIAAQWLNEIAVGQKKAAATQSVLAVDRADRFENRAVVVEEIHPNCVGRVHFQSTDWPARCDLEIILPCGEIVCVVDRENLTLFVEPL